MTIRKRVKLLSVPALLAAVLLVVYASYGPLYDGPPSDHFDGKYFFNAEPDHTFGAMVKWLWEMETVDWPEWVNDPPQTPPPSRVLSDSLRVTFIGHATVLIQTDSVNILTDPIWSERAGPVSWAGTKRIRAPGVAIQDLPRIDVILLSHDHYDHLDLPTLRLLAERDHPQILAGLGVGRLLASEDISNVVDMDWWQEYAHSATGVRFTFVPAQHNSGRSLWGDNRTLWGGFVIEGSGGRIYFAGDTGYGQFLNAIRDRFDGFRLAVLPIGNYEKRWFMKSQHMNPDDAVMTHTLLNAQQSVGIHYATFVEHPEQTVIAHELDLAAALRTREVPATEFWILRFGEGRMVQE